MSQSKQQQQANNNDSLTQPPPALSKFKSSRDMQDLMRRLYTVHINVGGIEDKRLEKLIELQKKTESEGDKKRDKFEILKVEITNLLEQTRDVSILLLKF